MPKFFAKGPVKGGLVLWLPMQEIVGGEVKDISGQGNDGTVSGAVIADGKIGNGLSFDGVNDSVNIPIAAFNVNAGTWEAWVNITDATGSTRIFSSDHSLGTNYEFRTHSTVDTALKFYIGDGADILLQVNIGNEGFEVWQHFAFTWEVSGSNTTLKGYRNGVLIATDTEDGLPQAPDNSIDIGRWGNSYFKGFVDDFRMYNRALSAGEIKHNYLLKKHYNAKKWQD